MDSGSIVLDPSLVGFLINTGLKGLGLRKLYFILFFILSRVHMQHGAQHRA